MRCCIECIKDSEIKGIVNSDPNHIIGTCDFCGGTQRLLIDTEENEWISEMIGRVLDVYTPISNLSDSFPKEKTGFIGDVLSQNWNIFNLNGNQIQRFVKAICRERYEEQPELFEMPVGIEEMCHDDYLNRHSILRTYQWDDFVKGIKEVNRFHSGYINKDVLSIFLQCAVKKHNKGEVLYRARICSNGKKYKVGEMGAPPIGISRSGRVNPVGISVLYLSDSKATTLYEVRAGVYDYITIGSFKLLEELRVINLAMIDQISPFIGERFGFDMTEYAINLEHLRMIAHEIAKPMRNDGALDYLPTQYISEFIKSKCYDGIEYASTVHMGGLNLAVFDEKKLKCTYTRMYDVKKIHYNYVAV
ncbi:MAG: RES family NAD+ phosphorylase [Clostridia bacterium]|nr:RES family NAD+ phosphorylase [Clostridia bacterium]